jgi:hypothetical protein
MPGSACFNAKGAAESVCNAKKPGILQQESLKFFIIIKIKFFPQIS